MDEQSEALEATTIETDSELDEAQPAEPPSEAASADAPEGERPTRRKIEEQLEALKRKEIELRRALVMADHPELADAIRLLQGRTYALERIDEKLGLGLTKAELRRKETLEKKVASLLEKRAELDAQITEVETELHGLGVERQQGFEAERQHALQELLVALGTHDVALRTVGIEATELVPELTRWLPEVETLAEKLSNYATKPN